MGIVVPIGSGKFNMDDIKDKFHTNCDGAKEAFEELCAMFDAVQAEREERREAAATRMAYMREQTTRLRERNRRLRARYAALVDAYNNLAEEAKERSDSSSSDKSDHEGDNCVIM